MGVLADAKIIEPFVNKPELESLVGMACYNAPQSIVLSGDPIILEKLKTEIETNVVPQPKAMFLPGSYFFHAPQLEYLIPRILKEVSFISTSFLLFFFHTY